MAIHPIKKKSDPERENAGWMALFGSEQIPSTRTLADRVTEALMSRILKEELPPGAQLPSEQVMALTFGVSRTVIREAISRLKSEGLIDSRQGRGAFVRVDRGDVPLRLGFDANNPLGSLLNILELRLGLDAEIARLAALRRTREQMTAIQNSLKKIDSVSAEGGDAAAEDLAFHLSIARAAKNPLFHQLIRFLGTSFYSGIAVTRANEDRIEELAKKTREEHHAIMQAILKRDVEAAGIAARNHIENASKRLLSADKEFWKGQAIQAISRTNVHGVR
jgi:DNA-binding FadR family transcriptional regulator